MTPQTLTPNAPRTRPRTLLEPAPNHTPNHPPHTPIYYVYVGRALGGPPPRPRFQMRTLKASDFSKRDVDQLRFWQLSYPHARARSNFPPRRRPPEWDSQACQGCAPSAILSLVLCVSQPRR